MFPPHGEIMELVIANGTSPCPLHKGESYMRKLKIKCTYYEETVFKNLAKRIEEMENKIEYTSMSVKEEREVGFENSSVRNSKTAKLPN